MSLPEEEHVERWIATADEDITVHLIDELLSGITDDFWVVAACTDRLVDDVAVQRHLIQIGLVRTEEAAKKAQEVVELTKANGTEQDSPDVSSESVLEFGDDTRELVALRRLLLSRRDRVETYAAMAEQERWKLPQPEEEIEEMASPVAVETTPEPDDDLDPWADEVEAASVSDLPPSSSKSHDTTASIPPPISLSTFLISPIPLTAFRFASTLHFGPLRTLLTRHTPELFPYRIHIWNFTPKYVEPAQLFDILPAFDFSSSQEALPSHNPWRATSDWAESLDASLLIKDLAPPFLPPEPTTLASYIPRNEPLTDQELTHWYKNRVSQVDSETGFLDVALGFVQHGASQGIPGLDELGEELSLLNRLVYDASSDGITEDWSLTRWRSMDTNTVVRAYLSHSTALTIANDIKRLVMPYLYVLEARAERAGSPDPTIPSRHLYDYILTAPLDIVAAIFDASKATLPLNQRIVKDDEDVARLSLACLYGSDALFEWSRMSQIFECMPEFTQVGDEEEEENEATADTTLQSLAAFVTPSTARPKATPKDLLLFFSPLPARSLSRALDVLDIHLESGEILSRWDVPAPLRWFLQSADNEAEQRAWAIRMARRNRSIDDTEDDDEWLDLMKDMVRLAGGGEGPLRTAFGLIKKEEVIKIFFGGLLSMGKFNLARRLLNPPKGGRPLSKKVIEELCLQTSREFYDNSSSGNLNFGDMKLAYECLGVASPSAAITAEKEFVEATSKICSYDVQTRPGIPISPIEIRLVKNRLNLVAQVLSSSEKAYKHSEVILDIVKKLGYRGNIAAEVKALAMLVDSATQAEDFVKAAEISERMVKTAKELQNRLRLNPHPAANSEEHDESHISPEDAMEVCWRTCFQLGRQPEFPDVPKKLSLLGHALQLCPAENALDVLTVWRRLEGESLQASHARRSREPRGTRTKNGGRGRREVPGFSSARLPSLSSHLLSMPNAPLSSEAAAAMASRTFNRMAGVAANLPFSIRGRLRDDEVSSTRSGRSASNTGRSPSSDVSRQASSVFARGVGWLIGADDDENGS